MVLQEYTLLSVRRCVGLIMPCLVIMEPTLEITAPSMDTLVMCVKLGWTGKYQILRRREMELGNMPGSLRDSFKDSHNARSTENGYENADPQKSLGESISAVKTDPAYTEDSADLSEVVKAPEQAY